MFEIIKHNDVVDKVKRRRIVDVTFSDGSSTFAKSFEFSVNEELATIKRVVKSYLDELNFVPETVTDFAVAEEVAPAGPTAAELARTEWEQDKAKLMQLDELIRIGVFNGTETQITNLRTKVRTNFKAEYLG